MADENTQVRLSPPDIKALVQEVGDKLEALVKELREGSDYANIRPSDSKMFMLISEQPRTISQLARTLRVSRQAAHASIGRLAQFKIVELQPAPGSRRDKVAIITESGHKAQEFAARHTKAIEAALEEKIGKERLETLRGILMDILSGNLD